VNLLTTGGLWVDWQAPTCYDNTGTPTSHTLICWSQQSWSFALGISPSTRILTTTHSWADTPLRRYRSAETNTSRDVHSLSGSTKGLGQDKLTATMVNRSTALRLSGRERKMVYFPYTAICFPSAALPPVRQQRSICHAHSILSISPQYFLLFETSPVNTLRVINRLAAPNSINALVV
jgi:hypothetical protein